MKELDREMSLHGLLCICFALTMLAPLSAPSQTAESRAAVEPSAGQALEIKPSDRPSLTTTEIGIPRLLRVSGALRASNNSESSTEALTFSIYKKQTGGTSLWSEIQNVPISPDGSYTALLGAGTADGLPVELFSDGEARWLGVRLTGQEEQARIMLASVPYALKAADAESLGGKPASAYLTADQVSADVVRWPRLQVGPNSEASGTPVVKAPVTPKKPVSVAAINGSGSTNFITKFTDNVGTIGNSLLFDSGQGIGLNSTSPRTTLDVNGQVVTTNRFTLAQDTGTSTPTWHLDNSSSLFRLFWQPNINTGGTVVMAATTAGNVGLNTVSPRTTLDVNGQVVTTNRFTLAQDTGTSTPTWHLDNSSSLFRLFWQPNINTGGTVVMVATTVGNVGIGTTSPTQKLSVAGNIGFVGSGSGIVFADGTTQATATLRGPAGPQGPVGPQGPPGPTLHSSASCFNSSQTITSCGCSRTISASFVSNGNTCFVTSDTGSCNAGSTTTPPQFGACCSCAL